MSASYRTDAQDTNKMFALTQNKFLHILISIITALVLLHLLFQHFKIIFFNYPLEYRENADLVRAYLLSIGKNVYAYENLPSSHSQYGFLYPWLGSKLLSYTGIHFYPLRLITALAILPTLGLFIWQGVKEKLDALDLFLVCGIFYASCLIHPGNLLAVPNTLGLAFFSLSVLLPPFLKFNKISLTASCIFAGLGFFTKIYLGLGAFYILLYLLVNKEWGGFRFMLMCLIITVATSVIITIYLMPAFYETTIELNANLASWKPKLIWLQSRYFIEVFFSFIALLVTSKWLCPQYTHTIKNPYLFGLIISSLILIKMGAHDGQFFLYFQQLLIPFLIPLSIKIIKINNRKSLISILLFLNLLFIYYLSFKHNDLESIERSFHEVEIKTALLDPNADFLYNPPTSYFAINLGKIPNEQGHVEYLSASKGKAHARYQAQNDSINANIREHKYRQIFVDEWQLTKFDSLYHCYIKSETFELVMYIQRNNTEMWEPKSLCTTN